MFRFAPKLGLVAIFLPFVVNGCSTDDSMDEAAELGSDLRRCTDDGNACTRDVRSGGRCRHVPVADGTACPSGTCAAGVCVSADAGASVDAAPSDTGGTVDGSASCGDGTCNGGESCGTCPSDCGVCPAPVDAGTAPTPTLSAQSCSQAHVQAALNLAQDGDIVAIPAGTCTWTSMVSIGPKAIVVMGAGIDATVIVDNVDKTTGIDAAALNVAIALGKRFRLTGLTFRGQAQDINRYNKGTVALSGTSRDFRIDHVKFDRPGTSAIRYAGDLQGVVDHNVFDLSQGGQANVVYHDTWNGKSYGDGSFADALYLGTEKALYIEDNTFIGTGIAGAGVVDGIGGARFVFRHNKVTNENLCTHGTESSGRFRGVRSYEIYENTFESSTVMFAGVYLRGGTGVVFGNSFKGFKHAVLSANYRSDTSYAPFGRCTGTNPFDGNQGANGYPCLDQVGRGRSDLLTGATPAAAWPNQALEPVYIWNVAWTPAPEYPGSLASSQSDVVQAGRDFIVGTPKPGYTPYTYPHPLAK